MKRLNDNFCIERYGLECRLVNESDAQFILSLRLNPDKSKYIGKTDNDLDNQINWIREYKKREAIGKDYYFIYYYKGKRAGVNRIYDIENDHFIHGSWIFSDDVAPYCPLAGAVIAREIAFYTLNLSCEVDTAGIHENNSGVLQVARIMGEEFTGHRDTPQGRFLTGILTKESFENNIAKIKRLFPKNER